MSARRARRKRAHAARARTGQAQPADTAPAVRAGGYALRFALIATLLFGLYAFPYASYGIREGFFESYLAGYAKLVGTCLRLAEPNIVVTGNVIFGAVSLQIIRTCDAMEATILFSAAVVAFPGPLTRKALALAAGLLLLTAVNVLRISSLYYVLLEHAGLFEFLHLELWPLVLILAALAAFLLGVRFVRAGPKAVGSAGMARAGQ